MTKLLQYYESLNKILDAKESRKMERDYRKWLRTKYPNYELHHLRLPGNAGVGIKPCDLYCIPLTPETHRLLHSGKYKNLDFLEDLKKLHRWYNEALL